MNETPTYYETLDVSRNAPLKAIHAAYKAMSLKYHPDRNTNDPGASEKMKQINIAHDILSDPGKRADYDSMLAQQKPWPDKEPATKEPATGSTQSGGDPDRKPKPASAPFDQSAADEICRRLAAGRELRDICKEEGMPSFQAVMDWRSANPLFAGQLVQAHEKMFEKMAADGKGDPRHKADYTVQRVGENGWKGASGEAGIKLFIVSFCYSLMLLFGFDRYLNFLPSSQWEKTAAVIALGLGAVFAAATASVTGWMLGFLLTVSTSRTDKEGIEYDDSNTSPVISALLNSFFFYWLFVYGFGPAMTVFSSTVEKDIVGTRYYYAGSGHGSRAATYSIVTADLPGRANAEFYITGDEYRAIPSNLDKVHVHVALKQSFFGMTVENYILPKK